MKTRYKNGNFYLNHHFLKGDMIVEDGKILEIGTLAQDEEMDEVDLEGQTVVPGFIDIHTHGAVGVDVNGADAQGFEKICQFFASQGTTSWLGSVLTDTREQTLTAIGEYKAWKKSEHNGAQMLGIHLEGPFLAAEYKGAMPEHLLMKKPNPELLKEYQDAAEGDIRYITVSPEIEGIPDMIPYIKSLGIQVAIGHSGADYDTAMKAIRTVRWEQLILVMP